MRASLLVLGTALVLIFSGCVGSGTNSNANANAKKLGKGVDVSRIHFSADWAERALVAGGGHNHKDPSQHQGMSTSNFLDLGYDPLITDYYGKTAGDHACGETKEKDGKRIGVVHSFGTDVAFVIFDVTDATNPKKIGELAMASTQVYDLDISPDLKWVVLATSPMDAGPNVLPGPPIAAQKTAYAPGDITFKDACTGDVRNVAVNMGPEASLPYHAGNVLVDISNPRNPSVVDFIMYPNFGAHSVQITDVKGKNIVTSSVPTIPGDASYYVFMEIRDLGAGRGKLVPQSIYTTGSRSAGPMNFGASMHDGGIYKINGKYLAYLAYGSYGLVILDVDDVANPKFLSHWNDFGFVGDAKPSSPYIHEALPAPENWEGHHYVWIGEECIGHPAKTPTCLVYGIDDTDLTKPKTVGAWTLPVDVTWSNLGFSLHYLALQNRTLFATAYHGGVWAIDVSTPEARATMPSIGVYIPAKVSPKPPDLNANRGLVVKQLYGKYELDNTPVVLELNVLNDGSLVIFDMQSGLYTVRFDASNPAPAPAPWPLGHKA
jgi:hypothetical protein